MALVATALMPAPFAHPERKDAPRAPDDGLAALVVRVREGDAQAFEQLYRRTRSDVYGILYRLLGPSPELDDVFQDAWLQLHTAIRRFREESRFSTFAYRVCANVALKHLRTRRRRPEELMAELPEEATNQPGPEQVAETKRAQALVHLALERLPPKKRVVFVYAELMEMKLEEIATAVDAPLNTVRSRLLSARSEFPQALADVQRELSRRRST